MSRPVYQRASSTNLRPGTAARALEGKLAIVSIYLHYSEANGPLSPKTCLGSWVITVLSSFLRNLSCNCLSQRSNTKSSICRSQEDLEVCPKSSTVPEYELKRDLKESALPLLVILPRKALLSSWAIPLSPQLSPVLNLLLLWERPTASMPLRSRRTWVIHKVQPT